VIADVFIARAAIKIIAITGCQRCDHPHPQAGQDVTVIIEQAAKAGGVALGVEGGVGWSMGMIFS
jgi:hypothetical protein